MKKKPITRTFHEYVSHEGEYDEKKQNHYDYLTLTVAVADIPRIIIRLAEQQNGGSPTASVRFTRGNLNVGTKEEVIG